MTTFTIPNTNSVSRDHAVQFLYLSESEKVFYFSQSHFDSYVDHFGTERESLGYFTELVKGVLQDLNQLDEIIAKHSKNWSISRMAATDRVILRMAVWELLQKKQPKKAILNEAIDLAKKYGTEHSGSFVNGILDAVAASSEVM